MVFVHIERGGEIAELDSHSYGLGPDPSSLGPLFFGIRQFAAVFA